MFEYDATPAISPTTGQLMASRSGQLFDPEDLARANPLTVTNLAGMDARTTVITDQRGYVPGFRSDLEMVIFKSGQDEVLLLSIRGVVLDVRAARAAAESAEASAQTAEANAQASAASAAHAASLVEAPADTTIAGLVEVDGSATRRALDDAYARVITPQAHGAVGDGVTDDTAAFQAALNEASATGRPIVVPPATYALSPLMVGPNTHLQLAPGVTLKHSGAGALLTATGTEAATKTFLSDTATPGAKTLTAPGHELATGDFFRLGSDLVYDPHSTSTKHGEILLVDSVSGDTITVTTSVIGGPYTPTDGAYIRKITPVSNITIQGGTILGAFSPALGQFGISVVRGSNIHIEGVTIRGVDRRHVGLADCLDAWVDGCTFEWAIDNTMAYGVSFQDCTQDSGCVRSVFINVRHSLSTNNNSVVDGLPRRIKFADNTVRQTSHALAGSQGGGDAIDTHTAAEDIWIERNTVLGSTGQGVNFEAPTGRIVGNVVEGTLSTGISVHNESIQPGRITVADNEVRRTSGRGIFVRTGGRGTQVPYDAIRITGNIVADATGESISVGLTSTGTPPERGVRVVGNTLLRTGGTAAIRILNSTGVVATQNQAIGGTTSILVTDSAPPGDHPGFRSATMSSGAITITGASQYVVVGTEGSAALDTLTTINGGQRGQLITIRSAANARDVTVAQTGNIRLVTDFTLDAARDSLTLGFDGTNWIEVSRADFPAA